MDNRERIAELAANARQGNQDAFNELYRLTRDRAYFVAFTITRSEQDALDIVQDSYFKAWQHMDTLQKPEQFTAWLQRITGNTAKDYIKHHSPLLFLEGEEDADDLFDLQEEKDGDYIPDAAMDTAETRRLVMEIVDALPEDQRLCTLMYYYDDIPLGDIAQALGLPQSTVKTRLRLARGKISRGVEALEKNGTKLYGAAPIPLLIWLLRGAAGETSKALPPVILGSTGAGAAVIGGTLAAKIAAGIAAAVIVGGGVTAAVSRLAKQPATEPLTSPAFAFVETLPETQLFSVPSLPVITRAVTLPNAAQSYAQPVIASTGAAKASARTDTPTTTAQSTTQNTNSTSKYVYIAPSTEKLTTTATTTTTTTASAPDTQPPAPQKITKSSNGVILEFLSGVLPADVVFTVAIGGPFDTEIIDPAIDPDYGIITYNMELTLNGQPVQPGGPVTVKLPIPAGTISPPGQLIISHVTSMTSVHEMPVSVQAGTLVFTTTYI